MTTSAWGAGAFVPAATETADPADTTAAAVSAQAAATTVTVRIRRMARTPKNRND